MNKIIVFWVFGFMLTFNSYSQTGDQYQLIVKVENIKKMKGKLKLAVYDQDEGFLETALIWGDQVIDSTTVQYTFDGLKAGFYAVSIFQDENDNGKLDANFMGIPSEPYAFSNNAKGMFGPPSFKDCQFELNQAVKQITISL